MARTTGLKRKAAELAPPSANTRKRRAVESLVNDENRDPEALEDAAESAFEFAIDILDNPFSIGESAAEPPAKRARLVTSAGRACDGGGNSNGLDDAKVQKSQLPTPQTPRHRDVFTQPVSTPRHRVQVAAKLPLTPRTPRTPPSSHNSIYNTARQAFTRSSNPGRLIGRESERAAVETFIQRGTESRWGSCLYISGPPGTGKSALVSEVLDDVAVTDEVKKCYLNCMSVKTAEDVYSKLLSNFCSDDSAETTGGLKTLKSLLFSKKSSTVYVVILDEIDQLLTLNLDILSTLFDWALTKTSRLILIGIANALDLTDRSLPRLKARSSKPQLLPFVPYTAPQIANVLTAKAKALVPVVPSAVDYVPFLHPAAIQFCAKKVASQDGDLRKAFDMVKRALDLVERETRAKSQADRGDAMQVTPTKKPLGEITNSASPRSTLSPEKDQKSPIDPCADLIVETAPRATIAHFARVSASAFNNGTAQRLRSLNLQQKAALCALVHLEKKNLQLRKDLAFSTPSKSTTAPPTVRKIYEVYCNLCRREETLHPLTSTEFGDVINSLETLSLISEGAGRGLLASSFGSRTPSKKLKIEERKIVSCVTEKEVDTCLEGVVGALLRGLLRGDD